MQLASFVEGAMTALAVVIVVEYWLEQYRLYVALLHCNNDDEAVTGTITFGD
jgi:hypothetical protein